MPLIRRGNSKGLRLNSDHPAARGAQFLAVANGAGTMIDIITGQRGTPSGTVVGQTDGIIGNVVNLNTATTTDIEFAGRSVTSYSEITVAAVVKFTALGSVAQQVIISDNVPATSGFSLSISAANFVQFTCNASNVGTATAVVAGGTYFIGATRSFNASGTSQNGAIIVRRLDAVATIVGNSGATITGPATGSGTISISRKNATAYHHGDVAFAFMSNKGMPYAALRAWAMDPWSIFGRGGDFAALSSVGGGTTSLRIDFPFAAESGAAIAVTYPDSVEAGAGIAIQGNAPSESAAAVSSALGSTLEAGVGLQDSTAIPLDWGTTIRGETSGLAGLLGSVAADLGAGVDRGGLLRVDGIADAEIGNALRADLASLIEAGVSLRREQLSQLESGGGLAIQITVPTEFGGSGTSVTVDVGVGVEWGASAVRQLISPLEQNSSLAAVGIILGTISAGLTLDTPVAAAWKASLKQDVASAVETLVLLFRDAPGVAAYTATLACGYTVQVEYDGSNIVILVFDPNGVIVGNDRRALIIGQDRKSLIVGQDRKAVIIGN